MNIDKKNSEVYLDMTSLKAIINIDNEEKAAQKAAFSCLSDGYRPLVYICSPFRGDTKEDWSEPVNTFVLDVMNPSERKSAVQNTMIQPAYQLILSILVYTFFSRMFDLMLPLVMKHRIAVA